MIARPHTSDRAARLAAYLAEEGASLGPAEVIELLAERWPGLSPGEIASAFGAADEGRRSDPEDAIANDGPIYAASV